MAMYKALSTSPVIPWRLRHGFERWVESSCRDHWPSLYRWLHFGEARDRLSAVTSGPIHHFFGYYDKCPWNASGTLLLGHEAAFNDRPPSAADSVTIGMVRLDERNHFQVLASSRAWNWQQGSMLQWHPGAPDRWIVHNDRRNGEFVAVIRDTEGRELNAYDHPIYAMSPEGRYAYSVNFARLHTHRPGYGYAGGTDRWADDPHPNHDGIHRLDLRSGHSQLIVSLAELALIGSSDEMRDAFQWINHVQVSPDGSRIGFFHIRRTGEDGWRARLFVCASDGSDPRCLLDAEVVSHYDWLDNRRILIWAKDKEQPGHFWLVDVAGSERSVVGAGVLVEDGHVSFSPDRRWVLNDTYPDRYDMRTLMLFRWADSERIDLARLRSPKSRWWGEIRCDLHPRWSRNGTRVCIDSVHTGERQMYVADVGEAVA
jgi:hypothetical protein